MNTTNFAGQTLGQFELIRLLGVGGMGAVYLAKQTRLNRDVAVKILNANIADNEGYRLRFEREAQTSALLTHPNIVTIFDYGIENDIHYIAMPFIPGGTLEQRYKNRNLYEHPIPALQETAQVIQQIASALDYAHSHGVIHRDVKPSNIMFDEQGNAFLTDFGIARLMAVTTAFTATGTQIGTPPYMPPEQWEGRRDLTQATDQYALAVVTFQLVTGRLPFVADTPPAMMHAHIYDAPPTLQSIRSELPQAMTDVIHKAMAKDPSDRYPSVGEFARALTAATNQVKAETPTQFFQTLIETDDGYTLPESIRPSRTSPASPGSQITRIAQSKWTPRFLMLFVSIMVGIVGAFVVLRFLPEQYSEIELTATAVSAMSALTEPTLADADQQSTPATPIITATPTADATTTNQQIATQIAIAQTETATAWTHTPTITPTPSPTQTATPTATPTLTATSTPTATATPSVTATASPTPTHTPTITPSATHTPTLTPTSTFTPTFTATSTHTPTVTPSATHTPTPSPLDIASTPVHSNNQWRPYEQDFDGVTMVLVPAGCFLMGTRTVENNQPIHEQCFDEPFWIDKYEATNGQFGADDGCTQWSSAPGQPRTCATWFDAKNLCQRRGVRLPTEKEWEYAARGPDSLVYPWGNTFVPANVIYGDTPQYGHSHTAPVGSAPGGASWVGSMDMIGNVWEWTSSFYEVGPYDASHENDADTTTSRVLRGGSFDDDANSSVLISTQRGNIAPEDAGYTFGFRCARDADFFK